MWLFVNGLDGFWHAPSLPSLISVATHAPAAGLHRCTKHSSPNSCHFLTFPTGNSREKHFPPSPGRLFLLEATSSLRSIKERGKKISRKNKEPEMNRQHSQGHSWQPIFYVELELWSESYSEMYTQECNDL